MLITAYDKQEDAKAIAEKILSHNGETVRSGEHEFPVSMRAGLVVIPKGDLRYNELFRECVMAGHN